MIGVSKRIEVNEMKYAILIAFAAILVFSFSGPAAAQGRSDREKEKAQKVIVRDDSRQGRGRSGEGRVGERGDKGRQTEARRQDSREDDRDIFGDDDDWDNEGRRNKNSSGKKGKGPKFCRNGEGHPVHGRDWCREKGFGLGDDEFDIWERRRSDGILLPSPRRRNNDTIGRGTLGDILGDVVLGRLNSQARRLNSDGPLLGRMQGADELRIFAGGTPVARFVDLNGDRRADVVYYRR